MTTYKNWDELYAALSVSDFASHVDCSRDIEIAQSFVDAESAYLKSRAKLERTFSFPCDEHTAINYCPDVEWRHVGKEAAHTIALREKSGEEVLYNYTLGPQIRMDVTNFFIKNLRGETSLFILRNDKRYS